MRTDVQLVALKITILYLNLELKPEQGQYYQLSTDISVPLYILGDKCQYRNAKDMFKVI